MVFVENANVNYIDSRSVEGGDYSDVKALYHNRREPSLTQFGPCDEIVRIWLGFFAS